MSRARALVTHALTAMGRGLDADAALAEAGARIPHAPASYRDAEGILAGLVTRPVELGARAAARALGESMDAVAGEAGKIDGYVDRPATGRVDTVIMPTANAKHTDLTTKGVRRILRGLKTCDSDRGLSLADADDETGARWWPEVECEDEVALALAYETGAGKWHA